VEQGATPQHVVRIAAPCRSGRDRGKLAKLAVDLPLGFQPHALGLVQAPRGGTGQDLQTMQLRVCIANALGRSYLSRSRRVRDLARRAVGGFRPRKLKRRQGGIAHQACEDCSSVRA
jgi:hypothetical protein